jgi:hypothetical protein
VKSDKLIAELSKDWEWASFVTQYCVGRNLGNALCEDFKWWVLGAAALVVVIVAWWILGKIAKVYGNWKHRRMLAKVADSETMNKYRWSGHDMPEALTSSDQRAAKTRRSDKP